MSEKFNLKWNDFQTNVSKSFGLFRNESYLHDVTLVSDDFKQIQAHKLVLSACSEYFRNILKETKQNQPLLCLGGVNSEDIRNVLDYVYDGEVRILQEDLDRFLNIAQKFKLEGLIGGEPDQEQEERYFDNQETEDFNEETPIQHRKNNIKSREVTSRPAVTERAIGIYTDSGVNMSEVREKLNESIRSNEDGSVSCKFCDKTMASRNKWQDMRRHIETHLEGLSYSCGICQKTFRSSNSLHFHKSVNHKHSL